MAETGEGGGHRNKLALWSGVKDPFSPHSYPAVTEDVTNWPAEKEHRQPGTASPPSPGGTVSRRESFPVAAE